MKKYVSTFGTNLRRIRIEKGLSQERLGQLVGLSRRMIIHYEKYSTHPPANKVAALANALGISVEDLLKIGPEPVTTNPADKRFAKKLEKAKLLPPEDKKIIEAMINSLLKKQKK